MYTNVHYFQFLDKFRIKSNFLNRSDMRGKIGAKLGGSELRNFLGCFSETFRSHKRTQFFVLVYYNPWAKHGVLQSGTRLFCLVRTLTRFKLTYTSLITRTYRSVIVRCSF